MRTVPGFFAERLSFLRRTAPRVIFADIMAGLIPQDFIDELLSRIDIVDVISQRLQLKKSGSNYTACCPFHHEKTPSFTVSQSKQFYHCFGCQANGTAISFIMNYDQLHFVDAVEQLAESIGLDVPREAGDNQREQSRKPLYDIMEQCARFYYDRLKQNPAAVDYLKRRQISGETAKKFNLGFAPAGWQNLQGAIKANDEQLLALGMLIKNSEGRLYDRFRERIMFPIRDRRGRVIAFGGRILDQGEPKYLNSPETVLFHKGEELYGFFEARKSAHELGQFIIVEGYMDVIALAQHGVENAVATLGTATSNSHIETLFRAVPNLIFCFDGDRAGKQAAWRALKASLPSLTDGRDIHFAFLPDGEDPDSFVSRYGKKAFDDFLTRAMPASDFLLGQLSENLDTGEVGGKAKLAQDAKPLIKSMPDGVYKQLMIKRLETVVGTSLNEPITTSSPQQAEPASRVNPPANASRSAVLRRAVALTLQKPAVAAQLADESCLFKTDSIGGELLLGLVKLCKSNPTISTASLLEHFRDTTHFNGLSKLAYQELLPSHLELSDEAAEQELGDIMRRLSRQSQKRDALLVQPSQQVGLLSLRKSRVPS